MEQKRRFRTTINNKEYTIVGKKNAQHIDLVVDMLKRQMEQLQSLDSTLDIQDQSILIAINAISDQLVQEQMIMQLEQEVESLKKQLNK